VWPGVSNDRIIRLFDENVADAMYHNMHNMLFLILENRSLYMRRSFNASRILFQFPIAMLWFLTEISQNKCVGRAAPAKWPPK
jgi:hypothetical protein